MSKKATAPKLAVNAVIEAAGRLAEQDGLSAISMRRVAAMLGVTPMALYRHVEGIEQLRAAVVDRVIPATGRPVAPTAPPEAVLAWFGTELFDILTSHPLVLEAYLIQPLTSPRLRRLSETALAALTSAHLTAEEVAVCHKSLVALAVGYAALHLKWHRDGPPSAERIGAVVAAIRHGASDEGFTVLAEMAHHLAAPYTKAHYQRALHQLIAGMNLPKPNPCP